MVETAVFVHEIYSGNICLFGEVALVRSAMMRIEEPWRQVVVDE